MLWPNPPIGPACAARGLSAPSHPNHFPLTPLSVTPPVGTLHACVTLRQPTVRATCHTQPRDTGHHNHTAANPSDGRRFGTGAATVSACHRLGTKRSAQEDVGVFCAGVLRQRDHRATAAGFAVPHSPPSKRMLSAARSVPSKITR